MATFDFPHRDPVPLARAAAIRSRRESDPHIRARAAGQTMEERLRDGFRLARFAGRLRDAAR